MLRRRKEVVAVNKSRIQIFLVNSLVASLFFIPITHAASPGVTPGEFSVDASGSANYQVPIAVPPGTSGMQPSLSLSYNSRSGNGLLGVGWTLGGLSVITRCPTTKVQDGFIDGIDFDAKDRYCIDGQRLIQVTGSAGDYGKHDIEYRTEVDGFTKVVSKDTITTNNGPESFIAYTKSGQILEYGYTSDSRIEAEGKTDVRLWAVNKIEDTVGNYLTVTYTEDNTNGEYRPTQIDYTGNANATPVLTPNTSVEFEYATRTDDAALYFAGSKVKNTQRLTNIKTYTDTATTPILIRDYQLTYDNNGAANRSRLTELKECDGNASPTCFRPITFEWQDGIIGFDTGSYWGTSFTATWQNKVSYTGSAGTYSQLLDMNGDGLPDRVFDRNPTTSQQGMYVMLNTGNGFDTGSYWGTSFTATWQNMVSYTGSSNTGIYSQLLDMNGDGLPDRVFDRNPTTSQQGMYVMLNTGNGFDTGAYWGTSFTATWQNMVSYTGSSNTGIYSQLLDMNGDGLPDRVFDRNPTTSQQGMYVMLNTGSGFDTGSYWGTSFTATWQNMVSYTAGNTGAYSQLLDMNGDGLPDRVFDRNPTTSQQGMYVMLNTGDGFDTGSYWGTSFTATWQNKISYTGSAGIYSQLLDMNGDGLPDRVFDRNPTTSQQGMYVMLNTGDGFDTGAYWGTSFTATWQNMVSYTGSSNTGIYSQLLDMNGDGLPDRVFDRNPTTSQQGMYVMLNTGSGFDTGSYWGTSFTATWQNMVSYTAGNTGAYSQLLDMNGDGLPERVFDRNPTTSQQGMYVMLNSKELDTLSSVVSSIDTEINITYIPITDSSVYTKGSSATYPEVDIQGPVYVVSKVTVDDGIGGTRDTDYTYEGAKSSLDGRGFLGFKTMTAVDSSTGIKTTTTYSQTHPYVGLVERTEQRLSNDDLLGEVDTTFANKQTHTGIETDASHPGVLFPYASQVTKKDYEL